MMYWQVFRENTLPDSALVLDNSSRKPLAKRPFDPCRRMQIMTSPYESLPGTSFWPSPVSQASPLAPFELYRKRWDLKPSDRICTAGSCFAQHISGHLRANGYQVMD